LFIGCFVAHGIFYFTAAMSAAVIVNYLTENSNVVVGTSDGVMQWGGVVRGRVVGSGMVRSWVVGGRCGSVIGSGAMVDHRCVVDRSMVDRGMVGSGGVMRGRGMIRLGVVGHTLVLDIGDVTVIVISMVLDDLSAAIGEKDAVASFYVSGGVGDLSGIEVGSTVLVVDSIFEAVRFGLLLVDWLWMVGGRGMVDRGVVGCRGRMVGGRSWMVRGWVPVGQDSGGGQSGGGEGEETSQYLHD